MIGPIPKDIPDLPAVPGVQTLMPSAVPATAVVIPAHRPKVGIYRLLVALTAAGAVAVDLYLGSPARVLSYFTIQVDLLLAIVFTLSAWRARTAERPLPALVTGGAVFYALVAGLVYHVLLVNEPGPFSLTGRPDVHHLWQALTNQTLHTLIPIAALFDWLFLTSPAPLRVRDVRKWLLYPMAYLAFSLIRGERLPASAPERYLYPFLDAGRLGYRSVLANALLIGLGFFALALLMIAVDRIRPDPTRRRWKTGFRL
ncbi:Pr6Pr family membrane protein [Streptomyces sp. NPDC004393]|uniref:Pr6Pr family membrane protein n=1 Tax=Streptomyces sp. NPDC004533 TaxID=3154278 RepID=UPI0033A6C4D3